MSKTATIPLELLDAYVALQRAVEDAMQPVVGQLGDEEPMYWVPTESHMQDIALACLAVKQQMNNEQGK